MKLFESIQLGMFQIKTQNNNSYLIINFHPLISPISYQDVKNYCF